MTIINEIAAAFGKFTGFVDLKERPTQIEFKIPAGLPGEGKMATQYVLGRTGDKWAYEPINVNPPPACQARAELVTNHRFESLKEMAHYLGVVQHTSPLFLSGSDGPVGHNKGALIQTLVEPHHPERGRLTCRLPRHPAYTRFLQQIGTTVKEISIQDWGDLAADHAEYLANPQDALIGRAIRAATRVEYNPPAKDKLEYAPITFRWAADEATEATISARVVVNLPPYVGAGDLKVEAQFNCRVVPPKDPTRDPRPLLRVLWANHADYEHNAAEALHKNVEAIFKGFDTYLGELDEVRYIPL